MAPIVETEYARNRNVETATRIRDYLLALPLQSLPVSNPETGQKIITDSELKTFIDFYFNRLVTDRNRLCCSPL